MRGARMAPRIMRNNHHRIRQLRQTVFIRSSVNLTQSVRAEMTELGGSQVRALASRHGGDLGLHDRAAHQLLDDLSELLESVTDLAKFRKEVRDASSSARREMYGQVADGLGVARDADGNVIHVDDHDRPYVLVDGGEIVYVKVFKARITPKGVSLDARCTIANPDGRMEVLLVEPMPVWRAPEGHDF